MLKSGDILLNRYRIIRPVARGGMGAVYEARDERLKRSIALKETLISEDFLPRAFEHEATLLANLSHPVLPKVFDHFAENDGQYIIMEFISGDDLGKLLEKRGEPFPIADVESWYAQLLDALEYLHAHTIIHRDLKPANLKVKSNGGIVLLDFGLAKGSAGHMTHHASHQSIVGYTPIYAPLEQIRCEGTTASSDLYSLGATMYHLLTNIAPVDAQTRELTLLKTGRDPLRPLAEVRPDLPSQLADMLTQSLKLEPQERPASAAAMKIASSHQAWPGGRRVEPSPGPRVDQKNQPTVLADQPTLRLDQRKQATVLTNQPTLRPEQPALPAVELAQPLRKSPIQRLGKLGLAIPAALVLLLLIWFAVTHISSSRTNLAATPPTTTALPLTAENRSLYGGIEIGAKGVKAVVLKVDQSKDGYEAKALTPINTALMSGVSQTGKFSPKAIDETTEAVRELYTKMQDQYRVATQRIYIIGSSGLQKPGQYKSEVDNKDELVRKIESATGVKMIFLSVEQEARDSISQTIPSQDLDTGILVDIGSGNTKGGYQEDNRFFTMSIPYGTLTFTDEIIKQGGTRDNFAQQAENLRHTKLVPALQAELPGKTGLVTRRRVYLTGGIVWVMSTLLHPANQDASVKITSGDITRFTKLALTRDAALLNPDLTGIEDPKIRKEVTDAANKFIPENLIAGAELLQAVYSEFNLENKDVYFRDSAEWGWLLTYVKSEAGKEQKNNKQTR